MILITAKFGFSNNDFRCDFIHIVATFIGRYIHTYHSRFIPEGVAEASQIFHSETLTFYQNYLAMSNTSDSW
jgi:hypothetical protein